MSVPIESRLALVEIIPAVESDPKQLIAEINELTADPATAELLRFRNLGSISLNYAGSDGYRNMHVEAGFLDEKAASTFYALQLDGQTVGAARKTPNKELRVPATVLTARLPEERELAQSASRLVDVPGDHIVAWTSERIAASTIGSSVLTFAYRGLIQPAMNAWTTEPFSSVQVAESLVAAGMNPIDDGPKRYMTGEKGVPPLSQLYVHTAD